jgi:ABC-type glycerol-3-phosphate transport system permease component
MGLLRRAERALSIRKVLKIIFIYALIFIGVALFSVPLLWMVSMSFSTPEQAARPGIHLLPPEINWFNYNYATAMMPFGLCAVNTIKVTALALVGGLLSSSLVAFAFARLRAPGKNFLFTLVLATIMLPSMVTMIPTFIIFKSFGWYDTLLPLIVPAWFGNALYIFLMRQFFLTIPTDLEDAARIDGCSTLRIYWQIIMPLSKPVLVTVAVFSFVAHWNDFLTPLVYLNSPEKRTLALGLATFTDLWGEDVGSLMAAATVVLLPVLVIFFLAQRYFVQGVVTTGLKQ